MDRRSIFFGKDVNTGQITQLKAHSNTLLMNSASTPIGSITQYAGSSAPTGWLICDGSAVSRSTFSDLFDVISITYGAGNGTTTFNIPDLRTRVPVGLNSTGTFTNLGGTGGTETETLTTNQIPLHNHNLFNKTNTPFVSGTNPGNIISSNSDTSNWGVFGAAYWNGTYDTALIGSLAAASSITGGISSTTGGGASHNNLQPYMILNYIIYTGVNLFINLTTDISGVSITNPSIGQTIKYNGSNWVNQNNNLSDISGVSITGTNSDLSGQILKYNGTNWVNQSNRLGDISGVSITGTNSDLSGQLLKHNGNNWINATIPVGGCINGYIIGSTTSWSTGAPANATTGTSFTIPISGFYVLNFNASAYGASVGTISTVMIYIDGVDTGYVMKLYINFANNHTCLVPVSFKKYLTAGIHYLYLRQFAGVTDLNDFASFNWIYSPS